MIHSPDPQAPIGTALVLNPSVRVLWRANDQIQLELGPRRVIVDGVDQRTVRHLTGRPDAHPPGSVADRRPGHEVDGRPAPVDYALDSLAEAGFLVPSGRQVPPMQVPRLAADLAALRVRYGPDAENRFAARRAAIVQVSGTSRVAAALAALLGAAGAGRVVPAGGGEVRLHQCAPAGVTPEDEGRRFSPATAAAVARAAPECDTSPLTLGEAPDLVVLAVDGPVEADIRDGLHARGSAHLVVHAAADHGVVGPLVLPGVASCVRCGDLHRLDRDRAWSALAVQLAVPPRHGHPSDVGLSSLVASVAALQALAFLDGETPATINGTLEIRLPDWRLRRRSWPPHPECDCGAAATPPPPAS